MTAKHNKYNGNLFQKSCNTPTIARKSEEIAILPVGNQNKHESRSQRTITRKYLNRPSCGKL